MALEPMRGVPSSRATAHEGCAPLNITTLRLQPDRATTRVAGPTLCGRGSNAKPRYLWNSQVQLRSLHKKILRCTSARSADEALARVRRSRLAHAPKARVARTEWS